ncbi:terminase large subunit [Nocardiopsis synnemataformans]|uniref:terminase large subunit n=1 Tax=Nocardiopsis synnemataformans TaxID=61305 RepID=UPI003EB95E15
MELPSAATLRKLKLSPEVAYYLISRGIPLPDCPPKIKTPEPRDLPGAAFDPDRVDRVLAAFAVLRHTQGDLAGQPLRPDPWQVAYVLAPVFGWVRFDEDADRWVRIIRTLYVDIPRKNGKSTLLGGIAIYMTAADGEQGAQVIAAATTIRQAGFVFKPIRQLAEKAPGLKGHVKPLKDKITHPKSGSYFEVVSSAADAQHGANLHSGVIDELHVHKTPDLVETIETGTGSRSQPLIAMITTADSGKRNTIYDRKRRRIEQLARGALTDYTTYGVVWAADESDDPFVESTWKKANPGYGISPQRSYIAAEAAKAKGSPVDLAVFQRLHLGIRTKQEFKYIDLAAWDRSAGKVDETALAGREAYGGLDLAATSDLCSLAWVFPDDLGGFDVIWRHWTPEENLASLDKRTAGMASVWAKEGLLRLTPGNVADYDVIRADINADLVAFDVQAIGFDRWGATSLTNDLAKDGANMIGVGQGYASQSAPLKEVQRLTLKGTKNLPLLRNGGNPLVRWQVDNLAVEMNPAGDVKPDKSKAADKIDAVSALTTAFSEVMRREPPKRSAYDDENAEVLVI